MAGIETNGGVDRRLDAGGVRVGRDRRVEGRRDSQRAGQRADSGRANEPGTDNKHDCRGDDTDRGTKAASAEDFRHLSILLNRTRIVESSGSTVARKTAAV